MGFRKNKISKNRTSENVDFWMKIPSKHFTWNFHLKINIFRFSSFWKFSDFRCFLKILIFLEIIFLHDEIIFFVRIFFCDQVCISSNPRNHLEHPSCPHDDSGPPTRSQLLGEIGQIPLLWLAVSPPTGHIFFGILTPCVTFAEYSSRTNGPIPLMFFLAFISCIVVYGKKYENLWNSLWASEKKLHTKMCN